ncbi:AAA family ATPase [Williamsia muralis]|uniref:AAA family ATPase n=1 Tax=Williamsia marianensis TaxID=85044 RepID=UPI000DE78D30|nr:DUF3696 domain-containing protein [Williamsia marianensis]PVY31757.1 putative ATPase [Williamsia marianensis]
MTIHSVSLANFKCFKATSLPLSNFTLLSGVNGVGKSSLMQALLVIRQAYLSGEIFTQHIGFGGDLVHLGRGSDVLYEQASEDVISIGLETDTHKSYNFDFSVDPESGAARVSDVRLVRDHIDSLIIENSPLFEWGVLNASQRVAAFNYLSAERVGPRGSLPVDSRRGGVFDLGSRGEYVLDSLLVHQDSLQLQPSDPRYLDGLGARLRDQLELWLAEISPGVRLAITGLPAADLAVGAFSFGREGALRSGDYRATNVGFGLSYVLPVICALLAAPSRGLVLIENPEAHLHPNGQTKMGELCARAAAAGVQVVIETHSDHVLDGARLAVRDGIIDAGDVSIHYFSTDLGRSIIESPTIDANGRLSDWPPGFFDQHRRSAARLAQRPRRHGNDA